MLLDGPKPVLLDVGEVHMTDYGRMVYDNLQAYDRLVKRQAAGEQIIGGAASFSDAYETKVLEHVAGKTTLTLVTPIYVALCTTVPTDASTGTTIVEAAYTGYARKSIAAADWASAVAGSPGSIANANAITFAACTGGTSTVIGFALCDAATVGNVIMWGTCTSTVVSTTNTPASIAVSALSMTLD